MSSRNSLQEPTISPLQDKSASPQKGLEYNGEAYNVPSLPTHTISDMQPQQLPPHVPVAAEEKEMKDLHSTITKLRAQNEYLRKQIKDLNVKLTSALESMSKRAKPKTEQTPSTSEAVLRKQLQTAHKQLDSYKKQVQTISERMDTQELSEKVKKLEDLLAEKEIFIEDIQTEKKVLEKVNREQEKELDTYRNVYEYEKRLNTQVDEIKGLREKIANMQAINRHNEKSFKKQQEHMVSLTRQYRLVCEKLGISPSLNFSRSEELNYFVNRKGNYRKLSEDEDFEEVYICKDYGNSYQKVMLKTDRSNSFMTPTKIRTGNSGIVKTLKDQSIEIIMPTKTSPVDKYKREISTLNTKIYLLESEKRHMKQKLMENDKKPVPLKKNSSDMTTKSILRPRSLPRIGGMRNPAETHRASMDRSTLADSNISLIQRTEGDFVDIREPRVVIGSKTSRNNSPTFIKEDLSSQRNLISMRKAIGGRVESGLSEFNDIEYITNPIMSKITKLMIFSDEEYIYGIQAFYTVQNSFYVAGEEHIGRDMKGRAKYVSSIDIRSDDRIAWISGKYSEGITFLKIKTVKGAIREFGNEMSGPNEFKISLDANESLALLHGAFYYKNGDEDEEDVIVLANIGFTLVKETKC